jgi:MOSC domain-containing protein YiiM
LRLVSVNVGLPREIRWKGKTVKTSIFKLPVEGSVLLRRQNLEGDRHSDLSVHGGLTKAVYVYSTHHYQYWKGKLGRSDLAWGNFGENFTVDEMDEETVCIGDEFLVGSARVIVTEPRFPCFKLGIRFNRPDMENLFLKSQRTGFYFGVVEEGMVRSGDYLERILKHPDGLRIGDVTRLYTTDKRNKVLLQKAIAVNALPEKWRVRFEHQLRKIGE